MYKKLLIAGLYSSLLFSSTFVQANNKVEKVYDAQRYQQVCKGKKEGAAVSYIAHGIIWNGNCQTQFFPAKSNNKIRGDEPELTSICQSDPKQTNINITGLNIAGKCALGFTPPRP